MIPLTVICGLLIVALVLEKRQNGEREQEWTRERQLLLSRIQHPEVYAPPLISRDASEEPQPEPEEDEIDLVGAVVGEEQDDG